MPALSEAAVRRATAIIMVTVLIDVVGLGIIIPVLPFYVYQIGAIPPGPHFQAQATTLITLLFSLYSLLGFLSAPFLGALSDRFGRRPILVVSLAGTSLGWLLFGSVAHTAPWLAAHGVTFGLSLAGLKTVLLYLGRTVDGFTSGNYGTAQSYLMDLAATPEERTKAFGKIAAVFGLGFIVGPFIGSQLSSPGSQLGQLLGLLSLPGMQAHLGLATPFLATGLLAGFNTLSAILQLPETHPEELRNLSMSRNPLRPIGKAFTNYTLAPGFLAWFLYGVAFTGTFQGPIFSLYMQQRFAWTATQVGWVLVMVGVIGALNQVWLIPRLWLPRFNQARLELFCYAAVGGLYVLMPLVALPPLMALMGGWCLFSGVARVVTNSQMASQVSPRERGELVGTLNGLSLLAAAFAPFMSGVLMNTHLNYPFFAAGLLSLTAAALIAVLHRRIAASGPHP